MLTLYITISLFFFLFIFMRKKENFITEKINKLPKIDSIRQQNIFLYKKNNIEKKLLNTKYEKIYCEFVYSNKYTTKTIICFHGYKSNGKNFISGFYECYCNKELEYNLCLFDLLGCGLSSGKLISIGKKSNVIIKQIIEESRKMFGNNIEIYFHGVSFGAYNALRYAIDNDDINGLIFDSGFIDVYSQIKHMLHYKIYKIFIPLFKLWYLVFYRENYKKLNLTNKIETLNIPILIFHSTKDNIVPFENSKLLFNNCKSKKKLEIFNESEHSLMCFDDPYRYRINIKRFIDNNQYKRIALIGFMSSGKTTLGKMISNKYNIDYLDIDEEIVKDTKKSLDELFNESEADFRKLELKKLIQLSNNNCVVLSCGGGTPQIVGSYDYLKKWTIIYLDISIETAYIRSHGIKKFARSWNGFEELCKSRKELYLEMSDYVCSTEGDLHESFERLCKIINENNLL